MSSIRRASRAALVQVVLPAVRTLRNGVRCEPIEHLTIDLPEDKVGAAIELTTRRKGTLLHMEHREDRVHLDFDIPSRGIIGLRSNLLTATAGEAVVAHRFKGYEPYKGEIEKRNNGSLVSLETGLSVAYAMDKLQDRGRFFIFPGEDIYEGQVVGEHTRGSDLPPSMPPSCLPGPWPD